MNRFKKSLVTVLLGLPILLHPENVMASIVEFGEENPIRLGDFLQSFRKIFPGAVRGTDWADNERRLVVYTLSPPHSDGADEVRFIFEANRLVQIDHLFGPERVKERGGWQADYEGLSDLFGTKGIPTTEPSKDPMEKFCFSWTSHETNEGASLRVLQDGGIQVLFTGNPPVNAKQKSSSEGLNRAQPVSSPFDNSLELHGGISSAIEASRPENGTVFLQTARHSGGTLKITNGTKWDANVKLVSPYRKSIFLSFYVHEGRTATVNNIRANTYKIIFALGEGWDKTRGRFHRLFSTSAFETPLTISKNFDDSYSGYSITLNPVVDGNAQVEEIPEDEFLAY